MTLVPIDIRPIVYPPPKFPMEPRSESSITALIYHHSDGPGDQSPLAIDAEHRAEKPPFAMIGYNLLIDKYGVISMGRPFEYVPSAAHGMNAISVDVCLLGDFQPGTPGYTDIPPPQMESAKRVGLYLHQRFPTIERTIGHRDVAVIDGDPSDATDCPGSSFEARLGEIRDYIGSRLKK